MYKAIMAHEHKYKYNKIQDSETHNDQHNYNTMSAFQNLVLGENGFLVYIMNHLI